MKKTSHVVYNNKFFYRVMTFGLTHNANIYCSALSLKPLAIKIAICKSIFPYS